MPRNGSGTYSLPQPPFVAGTVISSAAVNSDFSDIASALTGSLPRDGQAGMTGQFKSADGSTTTPGITFSNENNSGFSRSGTGTIAVNIQGVQIATITSSGWIGPVQANVPIGTIFDFAGASAPAQWILCFGQAVSRTTYALLFAVIGTTYGVGDGSTTFNLPDLRGYTIVGNDHMGGTSSGRVPSALTANGGTAGNQNTVLTIGQIPNIGSSGNNNITVNPPSSASVPITAAGNTISSQNGGPLTGTNGWYPQSSGNGWTGTTAFTGTGVPIVVSSAGSGTGAGTPVPTLQPSFALNKMIYAGV